VRIAIASVKKQFANKMLKKSNAQHLKFMKINGDNKVCWSSTVIF